MCKKPVPSPKPAKPTPTDSNTGGAKAGRGKPPGKTEVTNVFGAPMATVDDVACGLDDDSDLAMRERPQKKAAAMSPSSSEP